MQFSDFSCKLAMHSAAYRLVAAKRSLFPVINTSPVATRIEGREAFSHHHFVIHTISRVRSSRFAMQSIDHKSAKHGFSSTVIWAVPSCTPCKANGPAFAGPLGSRTPAFGSGLRSLPAGIPSILDPGQRNEEERRQEQAEQRIDPDEGQIEGAHADAGNQGPEGSAVGRFHGAIRR